LLKWDLLATGYNFRNTWAANQRYRVGDVIRYNGYTYQCILEHTSGSAAEGAGIGNNDADADSTAETWSTVVENYQYVGEWLALGIYRKNDLVKYGGSILKCLQDHNATTAFNNFNFQSYLPGFKFDRRWKNTEEYAVGDVVSKGGTLYIAITNNNNSDPGISQSNWMVIDGAVSYTGEYDSQAMIRYSKGI
jgi:chitodextrinase